MWIFLFLLFYKRELFTLHTTCRWKKVHKVKVKNHFRKKLEHVGEIFILIKKEKRWKILQYLNWMNTARKNTYFQQNIYCYFMHVCSWSMQRVFFCYNLWHVSIRICFHLFSFYSIVYSELHFTLSLSIFTVHISSWCHCCWKNVFTFILAIFNSFVRKEFYFRNFCSLNINWNWSLSWSCCCCSGTSKTVIALKLFSCTERERKIEWQTNSRTNIMMMICYM